MYIHIGIIFFLVSLAGICLFCNHDFSAEVNTTVHNIDISFTHGLAVDVENNTVSKNSKMYFVPLFGKDLV